MTDLADATPASSLADVSAGFRPLEHAAWYKRLHAWAQAQGSASYEQRVQPYKRALFSRLAGTVVELGPGSGNNIRYFDPSVRYIGIEPNPFLHGYARAEALRLGRRIELYTGTAEDLRLANGSVDAVVSSLVLCTVRGVAATLAEVRRVLRPGGSLVFIEHVAAERGRPLRSVQRMVGPAWRFLGDGCHPNRDSLAAIERAGFRLSQLTRFELSVPMIGPHVAGVATT